MKNQIITVFGANGQLGSHFVSQALMKGFKIKAFVRNAANYIHVDNSNLEVIEGNATKIGDVEKVISNSDFVVSCIGNSKKAQIMFKSHDNILNAASKQTNTPKCILISSIGCGGTSWIIKQMLMLIGGKASFMDYEKADKKELAMKNQFHLYWLDLTLLRIKKVKENMPLPKNKTELF